MNVEQISKFFAAFRIGARHFGFGMKNKLNAVW